MDANITNPTKNDSYPFSNQKIQEIYGLTHQPSHRYTRYPITVKEHNMESTDVCEEEFKYQTKLNNFLETNQEPILSAKIRSFTDIFKVTPMLLMLLKKNRELKLTKLSIPLCSCI